MVVASQTDWWVAGPGLAAAFAAVITLWLGVAAQRQSLQQRKQEQARQIAVVPQEWDVSYKYDVSDGSQLTAEDIASGKAHLVENASMSYNVVNGSGLPVYRLVVRTLDWDWRDKRETFRRYWFLVVGPHQTSTTYEAPLPRWSLERGYAPLELPIEVEFTDNNGTRWRRDPGGSLKEVEDDLTGRSVE